MRAAAERFDAGTLPTSDDFRRLIEGSSRAGGGRPKALVHDTQGEWLVKFPSRASDEGFDVIGLEATCLALARAAGLVVPDSRLQAVARRRVLMVRRFDVTPEHGRVHMVSLRTLCRERPGDYAHSYSDLADALHKHSAAPSADVTALFGHMVFDLVPDLAGRGEHTVTFHMGYACPNQAELVALAGAWRVRDAPAVIRQVTEAVSRFAKMARSFKVRRGKSIDGIGRDIDRRLAILNT